ncbi:MAG: hypothetical protein JF610_14190 [Acidobacteria bacterium]|nr:hypothetical protein [Acidobacteriota bacterium]
MPKLLRESAPDFDGVLSAVERVKTIAHQRERICDGADVLDRRFEERLGFALRLFRCFARIVDRFLHRAPLAAFLLQPPKHFLPLLSEQRLLGGQRCKLPFESGGAGRVRIALTTQPIELPLHLLERIGQFLAGGHDFVILRFDSRSRGVELLDAVV